MSKPEPRYTIAEPTVAEVLAFLEHEIEATQASCEHEHDAENHWEEKLLQTAIDLIKKAYPDAEENPGAPAP